MRARIRLLVGIAMLIGVHQAAGQGPAVQAGRLFDGEGLSSMQASWSTPLLGPIGTDLGGVLWSGPATGERRLGLVADVSLFRGGRAGLYAAGGVSGGFGAGGAEHEWRSWSAGLGYELIPASFLSFGLEGRWRDLEPSGRAGIELSLRVASRFGGSTPSAPTTRPSSAAGRAGRVPLMTVSERGDVSAHSSAEVIVSDVLRVAEAQIGTPYQYGGTGQGRDGFDCSGLIQFAYGEAGVALPRRSRDQARAGTAVSRSEASLKPGDILTFAQTGTRVTHVGLYLGDGRFIHSASKGVQISRLGVDDPNGRWWYERWVGVRRVVPATP